MAPKFLQTSIKKNLLNGEDKRIRASNIQKHVTFALELGTTEKKAKTPSRKNDSNIRTSNRRITYGSKHSVNMDPALIKRASPTTKKVEPAREQRSHDNQKGTTDVKSHKNEKMACMNADGRRIANVRHTIQEVKAGADRCIKTSRNFHGNIISLVENTAGLAFLEYNLKEFAAAIFDKEDKCEELPQATLTLDKEKKYFEKVNALCEGSKLQMEILRTDEKKAPLIIPQERSNFFHDVEIFEEILARATSTLEE